MLINKRLTVAVMAALSLFVPAFVQAADENDIIAIEKQLIQKEQSILEPELKLDKLIVERAKLDGMGGWFQGSKKKEIERQMGECETSINQMEGEMNSLRRQIQQAVYAVASTYEQKGEYKKAIEFYLKVSPQTNEVVYRIAMCHKSLKDYEQAIAWLLRLPASDPTSLEVVDCYKLSGRMKEAIYWLFRVIEPIDGNPAELTALDLIEKYDYSGRLTDYPDFFQRLSNAWIAKAIRNHPKDYNTARADYTKAITLISQNSDPKTVSFGVMSRFQNEYGVAMDILNQQRDAAERNYQDRLNNAKRDYDFASDRFRRAQYDADQEYNRRLEEARRQVHQADEEYRRLQQQASPSADLIERARQNAEYARNQYNYVASRRLEIIDEYMRPYRREMDEAMNRYQDLMNRRGQIIEEYIAPYKRNVENAKYWYEVIRNLHEAVYGR